MINYFIRRFIQTLFVLLGASFIIFIFVHISPGDPVKMILGDNYNEEVGSVLRSQLGLDRPLMTQFTDWLGRVVKGDFGRSYFTKELVWDMIVDRLPYTAGLATFGILLAILLAIPLGVLSAVKSFTIFDNLARVIAILGMSMPIFWVGLLLLILFSLKLGILPSTGSVENYGLKALILPSVALGLSTAALVTRMTRSSLLEVLGQDYVRTARSKGLAERCVLYTHALKNAILPVITVVGLQFGSLLGGAVVTETVFSVPGLGRLLVQAIFWRDYPLIQGCVLVITVFFVVINFLVDTLYAVIDPRISLN